MKAAEQYKILSERVDFNEEFCGDGLVCESSEHDIDIYPTTSNYLAGVLVKDIAALCAVYCWSFGIYVSDGGRPYISVCKE